MGLLSDPEYGSLRWVRILKKFHTFFSFVCYLGGISWFFLLACKEFNNETYFSENALLPGLATNEFNAESANQFHNEFLRELEDKYDNTDEMPVDWLIAKMAQLHLEVYTHNFTLDYPLGPGQTFVGTNVYGILRAPRTSSLEALVISAPYRPLSSHLKGTTAGIALMLAFAQFARPQKYWAKDIIFLITEHEQLGMQAWLEAYHGLQKDPENFYESLGSFYKPGMPTLELGKLLGYKPKFGHSKCLNPGKLTGRSGSIQAAINLELHTPKIKYIAVEVEGLNGQLPNLDLVNLVLKLCMKAGIHHSFKSSYSWMRNQHKGDDWYTSINTMLRMAQAQVTGVPNGNHGLFHRYGIEAVTLVGRDASDDVTAPKVNSLSSANFYRLGNALENVMRSMNNLLERFHQSYFFYMLSATNRFISIGQYMPSLCLMCVALLVRALGFWVGIQKDLDDEPQDTTTKDKDQSKTEKDKNKTENDQSKTEKDKNKSEKDEKQAHSTDKTEKDQTGLPDETKSKVPGDKKERGELRKGREDKTERKTRTELSFSIIKIAANLLLVHLLGYNALTWPFYSTWLGATFNLPSETSVYSGLAILSVISTILVAILPKLFRSRAFTQEELTLINILVLVELATALLAIGMHNFPLGFFLATVMTPVALVIRIRDDEDISTFRARVQGALCLLHQPLLALTTAMVMYAWLLFPEEKYQEIIERGLGAVAQAIMFSVVDSLIYGNWVFNVVSQVIFPVWLILWQITCLQPQLPSSGIKGCSNTKQDAQSKKCR